MNENLKKSQKILKILLTRNPNCSGYVYYLFILGVSGSQFLLSLFGGYFLYHRFAHSLEEKIQNWIKKARVRALILFGIVFGGGFLFRILFKIFSNNEFFLDVFTSIGILFFLLSLIFSIPFGFFLGISLWNLKLFQKHPMIRFIFLPLIIWWGMMLYSMLSFALLFME